MNFVQKEYFATQSSAKLSVNLWLCDFTTKFGLLSIRNVSRMLPLVITGKSVEVQIEVLFVGNF